MVPEFSEFFGMLSAKAHATFSCLLLLRLAVSNKCSNGLTIFKSSMVPMNPSKGWKAKLERVCLIKVQSGKITVCTTFVFHGGWTQCM